MLPPRTSPPRAHRPSTAAHRWLFSCMRSNSPRLTPTDHSQAKLYLSPLSRGRHTRTQPAHTSPPTHPPTCPPQLAFSPHAAPAATTSTPPQAASTSPCKAHSGPHGPPPLPTSSFRAQIITWPTRRSCYRPLRPATASYSCPFLLRPVGVRFLQEPRKGVAALAAPATASYRPLLLRPVRVGLFQEPRKRVAVLKRGHVAQRGPHAAQRHLHPLEGHLGGVAEGHGGVGDAAGRGGVGCGAVTSGGGGVSVKGGAVWGRNSGGERARTGSGEDVR